MDYSKKPGERIEMIGTVINTEKPTISIVTPFYNGGKTLMETANAVFSQTYPHFEWIIVDDGSREECAAICDSLAKTDDRIRVIHKQNKGPGFARNTGMEAATGEYIGFVDSDDFVELTMMEKLYSKAIKKDADLVIGNVFLYFADTGKTQVFRDERFFTYLSGRVFKFEDQPSLVSCIGAWDRIYKRELITENNLQFPVGMIYEDQPFSIQAMACAKRITAVSEPLYYYRKNSFLYR